MGKILWTSQTATYRAVIPHGLLGNTSVKLNSFKLQWCHLMIQVLVNTGWGNGLAPSRCQAIASTNADILSIGPFGTNFNEISIKISIFSFKKIHFKMLSAKCQPFCSGFNVSTTLYSNTIGSYIIIQSGIWALVDNKNKTYTQPEVISGMADSVQRDIMLMTCISYWLKDQREVSKWHQH